MPRFSLSAAAGWLSRIARKKALLYAGVLLAPVLSLAGWRLFGPPAELDAVQAFLDHSRTGDSPAAFLGSYGRKRYERRDHPFDRFGQPIWPGVTAREIARVEVSKSEKWKIGASWRKKRSLHQVLARTGLGMQETYELAISEVEDLSTLTAALNDSIAADRRLFRFLSDPQARVVIATATATSGTSAIDVDAFGRVGAADSLGGDPVVYDSVSRRTRTSLKGAVVVQYRLGRFCWSGRTIALIVRDEIGSSDRCPKGMTHQPT